jgi:hypothetical protein
MPKAKIVGSASAPTGSLTLEDIRNLIIQMGFEQSKVTNDAIAAVKKAQDWEPSPAIFIPNQRAYDSAPEWRPGAKYWKTGSRPDNAPAHLNG